jgi:hypothetical protein
MNAVEDLRRLLGAKSAIDWVALSEVEQVEAPDYLDLASRTSD